MAERESLASGCRAVLARAGRVCVLDSAVALSFKDRLAKPFTAGKVAGQGLPLLSSLSSIKEILYDGTDH